MLRMADFINARDTAGILQTPVDIGGIRPVGSQSCVRGARRHLEALPCCVAYQTLSQALLSLAPSTAWVPYTALDAQTTHPQATSEGLLAVGASRCRPPRLGRMLRS